MELKLHLDENLIAFIIDELLTDKEFKEIFARRLCEEALKDPTSNLHEFVQKMMEISKSDIQRQIELTVQIMKYKFEN